MDSTRLGELPEDCIATVIAHTSQWDACRLACVSRAFASAVLSDTLWSLFLPSDHAVVYPGALQCATKREIVEALAKGVSLAGGKEKYLLLRRSNGVCRFLSAMGMRMSGGTDTRYWRWEHAQNSYFSKVAHLLAVCVFDVSGTWTCRLPPGTYRVIWRLRISNPQGGLVRYLSWKNPLSSVVTTSDHQQLQKELDLGQLQSGAFKQWFEFEVGQVVVRGERMKAQELDLEFSIREMDCSYWKGGLFIDCLLLRPAFAEDEPIFSKEAGRESRKRTKELGVF